MTFDDLQDKYDDWKAQHPETALREPNLETVEGLRDTFGDWVVDELWKGMDQQIRLEVLVLEGIPLDEAHRRSVQEVA